MHNDTLERLRIHSNNYGYNRVVDIDKLSQNCSLTSFISDCRDERINEIMTRNSNNIRFKSVKVASKDFM